MVNVWVAFSLMILALLVGCAGVGNVPGSVSAPVISPQQFTSGDLLNAKTIATGGSDTSGAACWGALGLAAVPSPTPSLDGLAVLIERARLADMAITTPSCAMIIIKGELILSALTPKALPLGLAP